MADTGEDRAPLLERIAALEAENERLRAEVARLREGVECHVARPGEGTYECDATDPCPACRLRRALEGETIAEVGTDGDLSSKLPGDRFAEALYDACSELAGREVRWPGCTLFAPYRRVAGDELREQDRIDYRNLTLRHFMPLLREEIDSALHLADAARTLEGEVIAEGWWEPDTLDGTTYQGPCQGWVRLRGGRYAKLVAAEPPEESKGRE